MTIGRNDEFVDRAVTLTLRSPDREVSPPIDIVCAVDVSGSMGVNAALTDVSGSENNGLTILDLVLHAVKTISKTLGPRDRLAIVKYSTDASTVQKLVNMDETGQNIINNKIKTMSPGGQTNLWDGLYQSLEILRIRPDTEQVGRNSSVILLTDGVPNIEPPSGHIEMIRKYKDEGKLKCSIDTFGFGYNLKSELLKELAIEGYGTYNFIPDSGMVGTVFVNTIANLITKKSSSLKLSIGLDNGVQFAPDESAVSRGLDLIRTSWGGKINTGIVQYGQDKTVVMNLRIPPDSEDKLWFTVDAEVTDVTEGQQLIKSDSRASVVNDSFTKYHLLRMIIVDHINNVIMNEGLTGDDKVTKTKTVVDSIKKEYEITQDPRIKGLFDDLSGQVTEAISKLEWFDKWGKHYLPSLAIAHQQQICTNFKDPGTQVYGGVKCRRERDRAEDIFISLPAPTPAAPAYSGYGYRPTAAPRTTPTVSMRAYMNVGGGCFYDDCPIKSINGSTQPLNQLKKGDIVQSGNTFYPIKCIVRMTNVDKREMIVLGDNNKLYITPFHPIKYKNPIDKNIAVNTWIFPFDANGKTVSINTDFVYNIVLEAPGKYITIDGVDCCTLGHGMTDNHVIAHEYYGGVKVINDLKKCQGWDDGYVTLGPNIEVRDESGVVIGINI